MFNETNVKPGDRLIVRINDDIIACTVVRVDVVRFSAIWDDNGKQVIESYDNIICKETKLHKALK